MQLVTTSYCEDGEGLRGQSAMGGWGVKSAAEEQCNGIKPMTITQWYM